MIEYLEYTQRKYILMDEIKMRNKLLYKLYFLKKRNIIL